MPRRKSSEPRVWWRAKDPARLLNKVIDDLLEQDSDRQDRYEKYFQLYGGTPLIGIRPWETPDTASATVRATSPTRDKLRLNVVKAAIDTITSKVGKLQPRPTFLTNGGDWDLQLKAKNLQKFADGAYHQSDTYHLAPDVFRDAMIFGTGVFHVYAGANRICVERVPPWELLVDARDAMYGAPREIYRVKWVARELAAEAFGEDVVELAGLPTDAIGGGDAMVEAPDGRDGYVRVVEAIHLPHPDYDCSDEGDTRCGRRVLMVGERVLKDGGDEDYECMEFPYVLVHWSKPVQGYWGDSAVAEVVGIQVEVNKLLQSVQRAMELCGKPMTFMRDGALLKPGQVTNGIGQVHIIDQSVPLEQAVKVVTFNPVPPQVTEHIWALYAKAFEILGSNQLAASATAPAGLESGRALERLSEEHSERFMTVSRHFEYCVGEAMARQFIRVAKELDEELREAGKADGFVIRAPGGKVTLRIRWQDVAMDEDGYLIQVFPTSVLPTLPSARIDEVQRLSDAGWLSGGPAEARRLINLPDLEQSTDLATADEDNLMRQLADMLEKGKRVIPEPYQNLNRALLLAQQSILRAQADGVPDARIQLVRDFLTACETMLKAAQPPQDEAAPAPAQAAAPPAA